jgi:glycine/D-amino acid oxidase-like deaminating enzyme
VYSGLHAPFVVNACGASAALAGLAGAPTLPLRLHRSLRIALAAPQGLSRTVLARGVRLVPHRDGTVTLLGDPSEVRDASLRPVAGEVAGLLDAASAALPSLARWPLALRDAVSARLIWGPDDLPLLGETETAGYFLATAFRDDTVLLAPAASLLLADLVTRQAPAIAMSPFSPARFNL